MRSFGSLFFALALLLLRFTNVHAEVALENPKIGLTSPTSTRSVRFDRSLDPRQNGLANVYTCQTVGLDFQVGTITVLGARVPVTLGLSDRICLCLSAGALTPDSLTRLDAVLSARGGLLSAVVNLLGGSLDTLLATVKTLLPGIVSGAIPAGGDGCTYPTGAIPKCSTNCDFDCPTTGNNNMIKRCGRQCILPTRACVSNVPAPVRRALKDIDQLELNLWCPSGKTACALPHANMGVKKHQIKRSIECIEVQSDIEQCGGCEYPLPGQQAGVDCTAIPNVDRVQCRRGVCEVETCRRGFVLIGGECFSKKGGPSIARSSS